MQLDLNRSFTAFLKKAQEGNLDEVKKLIDSVGETNKADRNSVARLPRPTPSYIFD
jgi:hypothetical protein